MVEHGGIKTASDRLQNIIETLLYFFQCGRITIDCDPISAVDEEAAQFIYAVQVIRMCVGIKNTIEILDLGVQYLLTGIRAGIDQNSCDPMLANPFDQN